MKTYSKYILLTGSFLPIIWYVSYFTGLFGEIFWPLHLLLLLVTSVPVLIWYAVEISMNGSLSPHDKVVWIILLVLFGNLVQLVYWFRWVRIS